MFGQRPPETNPITIKPETASHVAEQFSCVPLPYCSPPRCLFPIKSLALSAHVSPWTIHFWVLDKRPVSGPGRHPPSCNNSGTTLHTDDESLSCTYYRVNVMIWELDSNLKIVIDKGLGFFLRIHTRNTSYPEFCLVLTLLRSVGKQTSGQGWGFRFPPSGTDFSELPFITKQRGSSASAGAALHVPTLPSSPPPALTGFLPPAPPPEFSLGSSQQRSCWAPDHPLTAAPLPSRLLSPCDNWSALTVVLKCPFSIHSIWVAPTSQEG